MQVDEHGNIQSDESEYTEDDGEYVTDDDEGEYLDEEDEDGLIEEIDEDEEIEINDDAEEIRGIPMGNSSRGYGGATSSTSGTAAPAGRTQEPQPWTSFKSMPEATQKAMEEAIDEYLASGRNELTLLIIGKNGAGKSSTANSLLNESAFVVAPFQQDLGKPVIVVKQHRNFIFRIIDTPGLVEGDQVNERALALVQNEAARTPIDVVLYTDRMDLYRVEPVDEEALAAVTRVLGKDVWPHIILGLTRSQLTSPPKGTTYDSFLEQRLQKLRRAVRAAGGPADIPHCLIENSSKCNTNDAGEKALLPHEFVWLPALFSEILTTAAEMPEEFVADKKRAARSANPNKRNLLFIPLLLAAEYGVRLLLHEVFKKDATEGDELGPKDRYVPLPPVKIRSNGKKPAGEDDERDSPVDESSSEPIPLHSSLRKEGTAEPSERQEAREPQQTERASAPPAEARQAGDTRPSSKTADGTVKKKKKSSQKKSKEGRASPVP